MDTAGTFRHAEPGLLAIVGLVLSFVVAVMQNTRRLYLAERRV